MLNVRAVVRQVAKAWALNGWSDRDGAMLAAAEQLAKGSSPQATAKLLPDNFYAANRATRKQVMEALANILINVELPMDKSALNLLFISSGPQDQDRLRLDAEQRDIVAKIKATLHRDKIVTNVVPAARPTDLIDAFNQFHPTILHISGHGATNAIALEDDNGYTVAVESSLLKDLVSVAGSQLRLVVLNACESAQLAEELTEIVDVAIGMNASVGDNAAHVFAVQLYSSIGAGVPLLQAFNQARVQIKASGISEDHIPTLYSRKGVAINGYTLV